jgi:hypothetical protein
VVSEADFDRFYSNIEQLAERGEYFYSIVKFVYAGRAT